MNSTIVFFDVGGTLIDCPDLAMVITRELSHKQPDICFGKSVSEALLQIDEYKREGSFRSIEGIYAIVLKSLPIKHGYKDISGKAHDIYCEVSLHKSILFPETLFILEKLHNKGVKMIIASDEDTEIMERKLIKHDLNKYFIDKCISGSVRAYKPSDKFTSHLKRYSLNQEDNCYFVGDSQADIECGKRLGINSVHVDRKNLGNTVDADYVIHDLNELLPMLNLKRLVT